MNTTSSHLKMIKPWLSNRCPYALSTLDTFCTLRAHRAFKLNKLLETFLVALSFINQVMIKKALKRKLLSVRLVSFGSFSKVKKFKQRVFTLYGLHVNDDARFSIGFLCRCCTKFHDGKFFFDKRRQIKFFFPCKLWLNSFRIVAMSLLEGELLGILGGGVPPGSRNHGPTADKKREFSTPVFRPDL